MNIAVLGTGNVGKALGCRWARAGHEVYFGARDPGSAEAQQVLERAGRATAGHVCGGDGRRRTRFCWGFPFDQTRAVSASAASLDGKIVMDCINPLTPDLAGSDVGVHDVGGGADCRVVSDRAGGESVQHTQRGDDGEPALRRLRRARVRLRRR